MENPLKIVFFSPPFVPMLRLGPPRYLSLLEKVMFQPLVHMAQLTFLPCGDPLPLRNHQTRFHPFIKHELFSLRPIITAHENWTQLLKSPPRPLYSSVQLIVADVVLRVRDIVFHVNHFHEIVEFDQFMVVPVLESVRVQRGLFWNVGFWGEIRSFEVSFWSKNVILSRFWAKHGFLVIFGLKS